MKTLIALAMATLAAPAAFAQVVNGPAVYPGNGTVDNQYPAAPAGPNYAAQYVPGTTYYYERGRLRVCSGYIEVNSANGRTNATCQPMVAPQPAASLAAMAPAAGPTGSPERNLPGDSNLSSDKAARLRSDEGLFR